MTKPLQVFVPTELDPIRADLQRFFDAMVFKLRANAHKGRWADLTVRQCLPKLKDEVKELGIAIKEGSSSEILMEAADVANWGMITANVALEAKGV